MPPSESHYTVLARRFRPQAFDDVVGQDHVSRALRNAIRGGRVAHAYMFTGARGVGKTSTARILAKALNCPNVDDGIPCNDCEICRGISGGNDVDVLEIDGASNRGIDDIRSLRANVGVRSMRTRFKVYIIDEVHMLTREAFNALLKTLEEPPPNVKFVFCTTEPGKVPDTILSRCQRFDFSSINETSIAGRLKEIAEAEGFTVSEEALELVARRARGSMRDSQSLFDQLLAFSDGTVSADDVHRMLGTAGDEVLLQLFSAIAEHRPGEVLSLLDQCLAGGVQPGELMDQAVGYVRDLMVVLAGGEAVTLCSVATRYRDQLGRQGLQLGMPGVMACFQILSDARSKMFRSTFSRTVLEMAFVQLSLLENLTALSDLLSGRLPEPPVTADGGEKKNSEPTLTAAVPDAVDVVAESDPAEPTKPQIQLTTENCSQVVQDCARHIGLSAVSALKNAVQIELVSESRIEVSLPRDAEFAKRVLEGGELRSRIESELSASTGRSLTLGVITSQAPSATVVTTEVSPPSANPEPPPSPQPDARAAAARPKSVRQIRPPQPTENLIGEFDPSADPFVRQVMDTFGATVVKITRAPAVPSGEAESQDA